FSHHPSCSEIYTLSLHDALPISSGQYLQLFGPNVQPRHCVVAHTDGIVTVTPCSRNAETYVHNQRIFETTILQHGMVVRFGKIQDRKSTRLNSSHVAISYAVFCL